MDGLGNSHDYAAGFHTGISAAIEIVRGRATIANMEKRKELSQQDYQAYVTFCQENAYEICPNTRQEHEQFQREIAEVQESIERNLVSVTDRLNDREKELITKLTWKD